VTDQQSGWLFTGLHWESGSPVLTAAPLPAGCDGPPGSEKRRPAAAGQQLDWAFDGPRRCIGIWAGGQRRPCPFAAPLPCAGTDPQCPACAAADPGRQLARNAVPGDPARTYQLYLAWFGPDLLKIGLTAADRGRNRLLEQGAIAFTLLAEGPYTAIRQLEQAVSARRLAPERVGTHAKAAAWWSLPAPGERAALLQAARDHVTREIAWPRQVRILPAAVTDQAGDFGLPSPFPRSYSEVTAIGARARLAGEVRCVIGRHLLLASGAGLLLVDARRASGRVFLSGTPAAPDGGLQVTERTRPWNLDADQQQLF